MDDVFVNNLRKALAILAPIDVLIAKYPDKVPIFEVMPDFHNLPEEYKKVMFSNIITCQEFEYLVVLAQRRFQIMYTRCSRFVVSVRPTTHWRRAACGFTKQPGGNVDQ
ncbi:unnamed protein product [Sphagnum jensenii]|uniref:Uncharacterized protein n=1 Tax=Sphagnum jensenii TaxID=128206 RepID=A0ABP1AR46_9BRYO